MAKEPKADRPFMPGYGISEESDGILPWGWAEERLANSRNYYLATTRPDGRPHVMAVWGVWFGGRYYFSTGEGSQKARNLRVNPECVVATDVLTEAVILEGRVKKATGAKTLQEFARVYREKYDWEMDSTAATSTSSSQPRCARSKRAPTTSRRRLRAGRSADPRPLTPDPRPVLVSGCLVRHPADLHYSRRWAMRFILGIIIGIAAGAALGLIIAPQSGRETRDALRKRMNTADEAAEPVSAA